MPPTETSSLLGSKISSSGSLPLTSSYEDFRKSIELELGHPSHNRKVHVSTNLRRHACHAILLSVLVLGLGVIFLPIQMGGDPLVPVPPGNQHHHDPNIVSPISLLDPSNDLGLMEFIRPEGSSPPPHLFPNHHHRSDRTTRSALPTNEWYQNLLLLRGEPSNVHRVYPAPYMLDFVGIIPGLRMHRAHILAGDSVMQLSFNDLFGLTVGATWEGISAPSSTDDTPLSHQYSVLATTELGLTLEWNAAGMESNLVRGMAYTTMQFHPTLHNTTSLRPTIASPLSLGDHLPTVDQTKEMKCSKNGGKSTLVEREIQLYFPDSDYTWIIFLSQPSQVKCYSTQEGTFLQLDQYPNQEEDALVVRSALLNACTKGRNAISCKLGVGDRLEEEAKNTEEYATILRSHAGWIPGSKASVSYHVTEDATQGQLQLNWDAVPVGSDHNETDDNANDLLLFALPHHMDKFVGNELITFPSGSRNCRASMNGPMCLVRGNKWTLTYNLPSPSFRAPRRPRASFLPALSKVLQKDIEFSLPGFFLRGAGDTYFSGKMVAKLARILLIAEETEELCRGAKTLEYIQACRNSTFPDIAKGVERLREATEIWINGTAETLFVYDAVWGGLVSCGCHFDGEGCKNSARDGDCPAFVDQGLDFGNGFYNDHHFHYGYFISAAATIAHFDPAWGMKHWEQILLLVRDIANPSKEDTAFPVFRHKDWYQGSSWASGVPLPPYLNGKNQESSSEAIASYESVALFGKTMNSIWKQHGEEQFANAARTIHQSGLMLLATELESTQQYWQVVREGDSPTGYPAEYGHNVVGILWSTMTQFGTWFGAQPYLPYGIQLLPLTPISEERDDRAWIEEMYYPFSKACSEDFQCTDSGWAVLQLAVLATVGYPEEAALRAMELPEDSFTNAGGNGHSRSNTIWYIATRSVVESPPPLAASDVRGKSEIRPAPLFDVVDCHIPKSCTDEMLDHKAGNYTCRDRIDWVIRQHNRTQWEACVAVAGYEFQEECGSCDPSKLIVVDPEETKNSQEINFKCPPCSEEVCRSDLNRCPLFPRTFVCAKGPSAGGCSDEVWGTHNDEEQCDECCELSGCQHLRDTESIKITHDGNALERPVCEPCPKSICFGKLNQCPIHTAPYLCTGGKSVGGCSSSPWTKGEQCSECCEIKVNC